MAETWPGLAAEAVGVAQEALDRGSAWKDRAEAAEARVAELEAALEEAEIEVSVAAHRLHFEDIAEAPERADELADLCERLRAALKGEQAK